MISHFSQKWLHGWLSPIHYGLYVMGTVFVFKFFFGLCKKKILFVQQLYFSRHWEWKHTVIKTSNKIAMFCHFLISFWVVLFWARSMFWTEKTLGQTLCNRFLLKEFFIVGKSYFKIPRFFKWFNLCYHNTP